MSETPQKLTREHLGKRCLLLVDGVERPPLSPSDVRIIEFSSDGEWVSLNGMGWRKTAAQLVLEVLPLLLGAMLLPQSKPNLDDCRYGYDSGEPHIHSGKLIQRGSGVGAAHRSTLYGCGQSLQPINAVGNDSVCMNLVRSEEQDALFHEVFLRRVKIHPPKSTSPAAEPQAQKEVAA